MTARAFQQGDVYFKQHSIHVCALNEGASGVHFALTTGEKKKGRKYPERLGFLSADKNIETYEKRNHDPLKNMM